MKIKEYVDKIVNIGKKEDMEELTEMFENTMHKLKEYDYDCYKKYKKKLLGMAYNYEFNEELATEIVEDMKPRGMYWDMNTTNQVKNQYGVNASNCEFFIVMNSLVNDYGDVINPEEVETYVKMANAFINDKDATEHKVWKYFTTIPKGE